MTRSQTTQIILKSLNKQKTELADLKAYKLNRSKVFTRAHYLVKNEGLSLSKALKQCWNEYRNYKTKVLDEIVRLTKVISDRYNVKEYQLDWNEELALAAKRNINFDPYAA